MDHWISVNEPVDRIPQLTCHVQIGDFFLSSFTMEQALQKCFVSISLQVKNIETEIQNLEKEREKIHKN